MKPVGGKFLQHPKVRKNSKPIVENAMGMMAN